MNKEELYSFSKNISELKNLYMDFSSNSFYRYSKVIEVSGSNSRYSISTEEKCDDSEAKDMYEKLENFEQKIKILKSELKKNFNIKTAKRKKKRTGCTACGKRNVRR